MRGTTIGIVARVARAAGALTLGVVMAGVTSAVARAAEMPFADGVGEGAHARMNMFFEVTFMKIDVAEIDAWLAPETAAQIGEIVAVGKENDDARDRISDALLAADTMLLSMEYARDSGHDRLMKGVRRSMEAAMKSALITEEEMARMYDALASELATLADRGVLEGDRLVYRLDGEVLQVVYADPAGEQLVSATYEGPEWAKGVKGAFFGKESRFRTKLVKSLYESGN